MNGKTYKDGFGKSLEDAAKRYLEGCSTLIDFLFLLIDDSGLDAKILIVGFVVRRQFLTLFTTYSPNTKCSSLVVTISDRDFMQLTACCAVES